MPAFAPPSARPSASARWRAACASSAASSRRRCPPPAGAGRQSPPGYPRWWAWPQLGAPPPCPAAGPAAVNHRGHDLLRQHRQVGVSLRGGRRRNPGGGHPRPACSPALQPGSPAVIAPNRSAASSCCFSKARPLPSLSPALIRSNRQQAPARRARSPVAPLHWAACSGSGRVPSIATLSQIPRPLLTAHPRPPARLLDKPQPRRRTLHRLRPGNRRHRPLVIGRSQPANDTGRERRHSSRCAQGCASTLRTGHSRHV